MKSFKLLLFLALSFCAIGWLTGQTAEILIQSDKAFGSEVSLYPKTKSKDIPILIDWGDGVTQSYNIDPNSSGFFAKVSGSIKGETIRILSSLTSLDASELEITSFVATGQGELKSLILAKNKLTKETFSLNEDAPLELLDLKGNSFTAIDLSSYDELISVDISDNKELGGIKLLDGSKLERVYANGCDISHFWPLSLPKLTTLSLSNNALMDIEIGDHYPSLTALTLSGNHISEISLSGLPKLYRLEIDKNSLTRLDLKSNPELTNLFCGKNQLTALDLSVNTKLTSLACDSNALKRLDISMLSSLTDINCANNEIALLDLSQANYMKRISAQGNQLTFLDLSACNGLQYLDLRNNPTMTPCAINYLIRSLWGKSRKGWSKDLLLEGSNAETADLSSAIENNWTPDVQGDGSAACESVAITLHQTEGEIALLERMVDSDQSLVPIGETVLVGTPIYVRIDTVPEGKVFAGVKVGDKLIKELIFVVTEPATVEPIFVAPSMMVIGTKAGQELSFALSGVTAESEITIDWGDGRPEIVTLEQGLRRFDRTALGSQIKITGDLLAADLSSYPGQGTWDNKFTSLQLTQPAMEVLYTYMNPIQAIDLSGCPSLTFLDVAYTGLSELDLTPCPALDTLLCYGNSLTKLDLTKQTELKKLDAKKNQLSSIDLSPCRSLTQLDLQSNQLTQIDLSDLKDLKYISLGDNKLSTINLTEQTKVEILMVQGNQLKSLDLTQLAQLTKLHCNGNQLTSLDLSHQPQLKLLQVYGNQLTACAVNDLYASLSAYPTDSDIKTPYNLYITESHSVPDNDAAHADHIIATIKGWRVNTEGDATGCEQIYVEVAPTTHGELQLLDSKGQGIAPAWSTPATHQGYHKVQKGAEITLQPKPETGYTLDLIKANGKKLDGLTLTPERYTRINVTFKLDNAIIDPLASMDLAVTPHGITALADLSMLTIFTLEGTRLYHQPVVVGEEIQLPTGSYLVTVQSAPGASSKALRVLIP